MYVCMYIIYIYIHAHIYYNIMGVCVYARGTVHEKARMPTP